MQEGHLFISMKVAHMVLTLKKGFYFLFTYTHLCVCFYGQNFYARAEGVLVWEPLYFITAFGDDVVLLDPLGGELQHALG